MAILYYHLFAFTHGGRVWYFLVQKPRSVLPLPLLVLLTPIIHVTTEEAKNLFRQIWLQQPGSVGWKAFGPTCLWMLAASSVPVAAGMDSGVPAPLPSSPSVVEVIPGQAGDVSSIECTKVNHNFTLATISSNPSRNNYNAVTMPPLPLREPHNPASNSNTYHSRSNTTLTKFQRIHNQGRILGLTSSPFYPPTVQLYGDHQARYASDKADEEKKRLKNRVEALAAVTSSVNDRGLKGKEKEREKMKMRVQTIMKPLDFSGRTRVLAEKSIWAAGAEAESKVDWPTRDELKYEGEQQARQGQKRRLPLPKEHKLKGIDRSEMVNAGQEDEVKKMERGEMSMPWRMKEIAKVEKFDDTKLGLQDRVNKGLEKSEKMNDHVQWVEEETVFKNGWLGNDLLNEL